MNRFVLDTFQQLRRMRAGGLQQDLRMRFATIWIALFVLFGIGAFFLPRSVQPSALLSALPIAAFLAIASMGQALVIMSRGIDLSTPGVVALSSALFLGVTGGSDGRIAFGVITALGVSAAVGLINGALVGALRLNALIATLGVGAITGGIAFWYRNNLPTEASPPSGVSACVGATVLGLNASVWLALALAALITAVLRMTPTGLRFLAAGSSPRAAFADEREVARYRGGAYVAAAILYGIVGILLSAFVGDQAPGGGQSWLLAPIAAAVLGATAIGGGVGSMIAVLGAALFLIHLDRMLELVGFAAHHHVIVHAVAIAAGLYMSELFDSRKRN